MIQLKLFACRLEVRLLPLLVAVCTKGMRRSGAVVLWLQRVDENAGLSPRQCIALLVSIPIFKANQLFFLAAYRLNQRRLFIARGRQRLSHSYLGGDQFFTEFDDIFARLRRTPKRGESLHGLGERLKRIEALANRD
jgi:hypothetical protein